MSFYQATFFVLALAAVASAVMVITQRNPVHSAIYLILTLLSVALIYLQLQAEFVAAVQIILYIGGIMVLFIFVIMLVRLDVTARQAPYNQQWLVASVATGLLLLELAAVIYMGGRTAPLPQAPAGALQPNTEQIGLALFQNYLLPFEIASVLLLVAMVGAVLMAQKRYPAMVPTWHYLMLAAALFTIGVIGVLTRRNIIIILMSLELILNAVNINLIAFSRQLGNVTGQIFAIFVITVAVAEAAVGLGILIALFRNHETVNADEIDLLKG